MKIELDSKETNYIKRVNEALQNNEDMPLFISENTPKVSFSVQVTDLAKANMLACVLMSRDYIDLLKDTFGISVLSINYSDSIVKPKVLEILQDAINAVNEL